MALNENDEILNNLLKSKQVELPDYNPNDEILNDMASAKKQNLQGSVYVATQKDPDRYAQVLHLSKKSNLPAEIVERNYDELSKKHDSEKFDFDNLVKNSPTLSSWMEDTNNSSVAHDDVDNLSKLEQHVNDHNTLSTLYNSFNSGLAQMWASVARTPGYLVNAAMIVPNLGVEAVYPGQPEMQHKAPDWLINNPIAKYYDQQAEAFKTPEMGADVIEEVKKGNYSRAGNAMLAQAASNAPNMLMMILGAASGMPTAALGFAGVTTAASSNAESMNQEGVSPLQSAISATTKGTIEAGFESLGTFGLFSHWEKTLAQTFGKEISKKTMKEFSKSLMYSMAGEANEEFLTSAAQDFTDYVTGVNPNALTDMWQRAGNAGIAGAFTGGTMTAGGGAIVAGVKGQEMRRTAMAKDFYLSMGNTAEVTKLRQRLPEAQRNLVEKITEGTDVKDIFVSTEALEEYFQSKNLDPASVMQETGTLQAYNEAKLVGSDVKIPLATWAHNFVGTEHYQGLANDIKFNPSDYSFNEIQKINAETKTKMETIEKENPVPVEDPKVASAKIVSEQITSQLKEAGFSEDIASTYSQLYGDVFGNLGEREGIDPLELFSKFGLSISRPELNWNQAQPGEQVASQEQVFNQDIQKEPAPVFYSKLEKTLSEKMGSSATVEQVQGIIKEIKPEERQWLGVDEFLKDKKKVSKQELLDHIRGNQLDIIDVTKGAEIKRPLPSDYVIEENPEAKNKDLRFLVRDEKNIIVGMGETRQKAIENFQTIVESPTKFSKYTLPGGENYREILFTMPQKDNSADRVRELNKQASDLQDERKNLPDSSDKAEKNKQLSAKLNAIYEEINNLQDAQIPEFKSSHFNEKNILAHVRLDDRVDSEGKKVLFVEEIQSDWHQAGRSKGYQGEVKIVPFTEENIKSFKEDDDKWVFDMTHPETGFVTKQSIYKTKYDTEKKEKIDRGLTLETAKIEALNLINNVEKRHKEFTNKQAVPNAPFKKTWHEFALKRIIREAAEKGYDKVAWTTGEQQAERYDLSKQLKDVSYLKQKNGTYWIQATSNNGSVVYNERNVNEGEVQNLIGKDLADKIVKGEGEDKLKTGFKTFSGVNLKVGGEGMKGFYDKILVSSANNLFKKFGAKVSEASIETDKKFIYEGPTLLTSKEIRSKAKGVDDARTQQNLKDFAQTIEETTPSTEAGFNRMAVNYLSPLAAEALGGKLIESKKEDKVHSLEITPVLRDAALNEGFSLFQGENDPRGRIRFGANGINIELLQKADLSTFLHETGHFYLNVLGELSSMENASEQTKKDYKTILDWFGVQSKEEITVDHHEQFARGFEAYLFEGKAPSSKLREAFTRFRAWLLQVYKSVAKLNVNLTPEVKNVFDRLVASDEEIKQAQYDQGTRPLFEDPKALGMSEAQANKYKSAIEDARLQAEEELTTKLMANVQKERESMYKEERAKVREEVEQDVSLRKEYITLEALQGKEFMEGVPMSKLSKQAIIDDFGEDVLKKLPRPYCYSVEDGIHPDVAAEMFGYTSGQELLETLTKMLPKDQVIDKITDDIMRDKHGDLLNDPHLGIEALKAVHNEKKAQLLRLELQYLAEGNFPAFKGLVRKITKKIPTNQAIREQATDIIKKKTYRDISPIVYQRAERKAATESVQAFLRGDIEAAFNSKEKELMNHELYKAAVDAVEVTDKFAIYALKFNKKEVRQRIGKAGQVYLDQIDALMERFDFKKAVSGKALDKRKKFRDWYNDEVKAGNTPVVPEKLLDESFKQSYKEVSYEDLLGIKDAIKNIEHFARLKNELIAGVNARAFDEVKAELVDTIYAHHKISTEKYDYSPGIKDKIITYAKGFLAAHTRMEFMFEFLDGNKSNGAFWNNFFRPLALAEDAKSEMMRGLIKGDNGLEAIMNAYTDKERAGWFYKKKFIKEINNSINKGTALAIALNWGNEYNREALLAGESWSEAQALAVMDQMLDAKDWKTIQSIWDLIDTLWPHVAKLESEVTGIIPQKVEATEVINKHGVFKGGYYPIIFDAKRSFRTEQLQAATDVSELFGNNIARSMTRHGHTNERSNTGSKPLKLELTGLTEHLSNVVHDLTHRKAVIDVGRLLFDKEIQEAIEGAVGREGYRQLKPWINSIANDRNTEPANMVFAALSRARTGATVVNLGLKTTSALAQVLGYFNTIDQLGIKYAMMGLSQTLSKPRSMAETWDFIASRSVMMKDRTTTFDRDVKDATRKLYIAPTTSGLPALIDPYTRHLHETYFYLTGLMDLGTAVPTWIGAYNKAMDGAEEGIQKGDEKKAAEYADKVVRQTQSAGSVKDLAGVQTGNELQKLFTMFYSQVSLQFNLLNKAKNQYKFDDDLKKLIGSLFLLWFLPATLEDLIKGRGPSGDDDPEKILKEEAKNLITYPFKTVVLLRDIMSGMEFGGYNPSPAFDAMESLGKSATLGVELVTGNKKEVTRTDVKNLFNTTGYFAGYPAKQMWQSSEYFYDWMTGRERPQNPVEGIARTLVYGKKKK